MAVKHQKKGRKQKTRLRTFRMQNKFQRENKLKRVTNFPKTKLSTIRKQKL